MKALEAWIRKQKPVPPPKELPYNSAEARLLRAIFGSK